jgi:hypothetical protein
MRQHISEGDLQAYHDGALAAPAQARVEAHLATCPMCQARHAALTRNASRVSDALRALRPTEAAAPDRTRALAAFRDAITQERKQSMWERLKMSKKWRRVAYSLASVGVLAGLLSLAPVRALASEFLSMFRVERFVVVPVGEEQQERLEEISEQLGENFFLGDEEMLQESEHIEVASLDEAASMVGFRPRAPQNLGEPSEIAVITESTMRFTPDLEAARALFEAAGLDPNIIPPEIDGQPFDFHAPASVSLTYEVNNDSEGEDEEPEQVLVAQMPAPTADLPPGVDPAALGEAMLQFLGMTPEEAARMSESIDWTSTLVLPIPTDLASYQEVTVDGVTGLLFESTWEGGPGDPDDPDDGGGVEPHRTVMVLWEKDGIVNSVIGASNQMVLGTANDIQ